MTYSDTEPRGTLRYRLLSASLLPPASKISEPGSWGHEYVRHLAAELGEEYTVRQEGEEAVPAPTAEGDADKPKPAPVPGTIKDLRDLGLECATFFLGHNAEPDAVDLFVELEIVDRITDLVDANTFSRVCAYMDRYVELIPLLLSGLTFVP
jgi:26S proteasome regulatory subunit N1